ncbi:MAG: hypothetical protein HYW08_12330 [candidate division NC10 bacterium]|nr:hypothetical protein [Candidatus Rokubacteria bacterium]MBI2563150.1 hypothetical protein [candidate division NC10 bacterium]
MKAHTITGGGGIQLHVEETGNRRGRPFVENAPRFNRELRAFTKAAAKARVR